MVPTVLAGRARRGADLLAGSLEQVPLAPQYPFERAAAVRRPAAASKPGAAFGGLTAEVLQAPERQKKDRQFGGFAYPKNHRTAL